MCVFIAPLISFSSIPPCNQIVSSHAWNATPHSLTRSPSSSPSLRNPSWIFICVNLPLPPVSVSWLHACFQGKKRRRRRREGWFDCMVVVGVVGRTDGLTCCCTTTTILHVLSPPLRSGSCMKGWRWDGNRRGEREGAPTADVRRRRRRERSQKTQEEKGGGATHETQHVRNGRTAERRGGEGARCVHRSSSSFFSFSG